MRKTLEPLKYAVFYVSTDTPPTTTRQTEKRARRCKPCDHKPRTSTTPYIMKLTPRRVFAFSLMLTILVFCVLQIFRVKEIRIGSISGTSVKTPSANTEPTNSTPDQEKTTGIHVGGNFKISVSTTSPPQEGEPPAALFDSVPNQNKKGTDQPKQEETK